MRTAFPITRHLRLMAVPAAAAVTIAGAWIDAAIRVPERTRSSDAAPGASFAETLICMSAIGAFGTALLTRVGARRRRHRL